MLGGRGVGEVGVMEGGCWAAAPHTATFSPRPIDIS